MAKRELTTKEKKIVFIVCILLFVAILAFISFIVAKPFVQYIKKPQLFRDWLEQFGIGSKVVFVLLTALQVIIAFIPGEPLEIAAGYCFGWLGGLILSLVGITIGSTAIYLLVKKYSKSFIEIFFKDKDIKKFKFLENESKQRNLVFLLNLIPGTPKDLLSYLIGLTDIKLSSWAIIVFFARIPSVITSTIAGDSLALQKYGNTIVVFLITAVVSIIGMSIYNLIIKKKNG